MKWTKFSGQMFSALVCAVSVFVTPCAAQAATDQNPPGASECTVADLNDSYAAMNCLVSNARYAYVASLQTGSTMQLPVPANTPAGSPCIVTAISQAPGSGGTIMGQCRDGNEVFQAFAWPLSNGVPGNPLQLSPGTSGVMTHATGVSINGYVIGTAVAQNGSFTGVFWAPGSGTPTVLPGLSLLGIGIVLGNCEPVDINDATSPVVAGNCAMGNGQDQPVYWTGLNGLFNVAHALPKPSGAAYCSASEVNNSGQILGQCYYSGSADTYLAVIWGAGGAGPTVLTTINGNTALRTTGVDMNDSGAVIVSFTGGTTNGGIAGSQQCAIWTSGTNAQSVVIPGATDCVPAGIGNNGKAMVTLKLSNGNTNAAHVDYTSSLTAVAEGDVAGGSNSAVTAQSRSGANAGVAAENSAGQEHAETEAVL